MLESDLSVFFKALQPTSQMCFLIGCERGMATQFQAHDVTKLMNTAFCSKADQHAGRDLLLKHFKRILCHLCTRLPIIDGVPIMR